MNIFCKLNIHFIRPSSHHKWLEDSSNFKCMNCPRTWKYNEDLPAMDTDRLLIYGVGLFFLISIFLLWVNNK